MAKQQHPKLPKSKAQQWLEKRWVLAVCGVLALILAYVFALWSIDSGSLLDYAITLLLVLVGLRDLYLAVFYKKKAEEA